jgi:hypothetical protein
VTGGQEQPNGSGLALATDPEVIDRSADPAGFVMAACERAAGWLRQALDGKQIEQIAEIKSQAEAIRVYTLQKQLGNDAQLAAAEVVRRAERGVAVAIRMGQAAGQIARPGDRGGRGAPGVRGGHPGDTRGDHLDSPARFFKHPSERADAYAMADGAADEDFETVLATARAEGDLSRRNVVRKIRQRQTAPPGPVDTAPSPADRSSAPDAPRRELIARHAAEGMTSAQIAGRLGIGDDRVRQIAREHDISIPADAVAGRPRRFDSSRIVRETVHALEGMVMAVDLADPAGLDPAEAADWAASMSRSLRVLSKFVRHMKEVTGK